MDLFKRYPHNPIISAKDLPYEVNSVFNPGATIHQGNVLLLVRVEDKRGISHITLARSKDGFGNWEMNDEPFITPSRDEYTEYGVEDPRVTYLFEEDLYAITYTAYSRLGPMVCLSLTKDFKTKEDLGIVLPPENKDACLFPERIGGRWAMLHRPVPSGNHPPHIWISFSPDLRHWGDHKVVIKCRKGGWWDSQRIGAGPPPIKTPKGWLLLYHGVKGTVSGPIYRVGLALLDLKEPYKVLYRSQEWVFGPQEPYEMAGDVGKVVFPCGWVLLDDQIILYYGAADTSICAATGSLSQILKFIESKVGFQKGST